MSNRPSLGMETEKAESVPPKGPADDDTMRNRPSPDMEIEKADRVPPVGPGNDDINRHTHTLESRMEADTVEKVSNRDSITHRRSERSNKYMGGIAKRKGLPWNHNASRLQIQEFPGMEWCLFAINQFDKDEQIAVYAGKALNPDVARSAAYNSDYIV